MPEGIDYAFGRPTMAALKSAGIKFVCRYLSHSPSKNLTAAEARKLTDAGIWIVVVWETTAKRALDGHAAGAADAKDARGQVGIYGGYGPVKRALDGGHAKWAWQTYAWSGGRWNSRAQLQQYSNGMAKASLLKY
jgi:hypothetical protein